MGRRMKTKLEIQAFYQISEKLENSSKISLSSLNWKLVLVI